MTKAKATEGLKGYGTGGYIYQYEKGHWDFATHGSPIGRDLRETGMEFIHAHLGIRAKQVIEVG